MKESAIFRNVRVIKPVKVGFTPYRDYIGSRLELLNVSNGHRSQIYSSRVPFEAPNWAPDGGSLFYQSSGGDNATRGRLYKFDLASRLPQLIDTGYAIRLNNDHVLSFDGTQFALSDNSSGESAISTMPVRGGVPTRITPNTPSYMHSWTLDAKWLIYTGGRKAKGAKDNEFDIYKIASDGSGKEINLTNSPGLDDGPELSPDGKWIYFNSTRTGQMQIWRMGTRRQESRARDQRRQVERLVPALLAGRQVDRHHLVRARDPADRPPVLQALHDPHHAGRRQRAAEDHRLRVRRPGHDQRAVMVTRRHPRGVRLELGLTSGAG